MNRGLILVGAGLVAGVALGATWALWQEWGPTILAAGVAPFCCLECQ